MMKFERQYLTEKRIASHRKYLADVANGIDTVVAWNAHKERMAA